MNYFTEKIRGYIRNPVYDHHTRTHTIGASSQLSNVFWIPNSARNIQEDLRAGDTIWTPVRQSTFFDLVGTPTFISVGGLYTSSSIAPGK